MKNRVFNLTFFLIIFVLGITYNFNYCMASSAKLSYRTNQAQKTNNSFYAVLDIDKVVHNSVAYKEFKSRWSKINDKYQQEIEFYESQLLVLEKKITSELEKKNTTGSYNKTEVIQAKQKIGIYEVKVQKLLRSRKEVLEKAGNKAIEILRKNIDQLIDDHAKRNKISIIFSKDQVIYFSNTVDITNFILKELNKNLRKLEIDT